MAILRIVGSIIVTDIGVAVWILSIRARNIEIRVVANGVVLAGSFLSPLGRLIFTGFHGICRVAVSISIDSSPRMRGIEIEYTSNSVVLANTPLKRHCRGSNFRRDSDSLIENNAKNQFILKDTKFYIKF